ncbi:unnamed protein product [Amoebophrya sp. A120]|nr:unnamed protein product [Amoebophrya sp. A120]|eukprot:GSA120T00000125001.1
MRKARWEYMVRPLRAPVPSKKEPEIKRESFAQTQMSTLVTPTSCEKKDESFILVEKPKREHLQTGPEMVNPAVHGQTCQLELEERTRSADHEDHPPAEKKVVPGTCRKDEQDATRFVQLHPGTSTSCTYHNYSPTTAAQHFDYDAACCVSDKQLQLKHSQWLKQAASCYPHVLSAEEDAKLLDYRAFQFDFTKEEKAKKAALEKKLQQHLESEHRRKMPKEEREALEAGVLYYKKIEEEMQARQKWHRECLQRLEEERSRYPHRSVVDVAALRKTLFTIETKHYDAQACFVTGLCYKQAVLGVGLEIRPEAANSDRLAFHCSFDLISKEGFYDFGVRTSVWNDRIAFWMPAAVDAEHFERAIKYLADLFQQLGNSDVAAKTRSYGTQQGSKAFHAGAQMREAVRGGGKICSLDEWKKQKEEAKAIALAKRAASAAATETTEKNSTGGDATAEMLRDREEEHDRNKVEPDHPVCPVVPQSRPTLTEGDFEYALDVLPKLMNSQVVFLLKGELHHSEKALEGYIGFHHLFLSVLAKFPSLQRKIENKLTSFVQGEEFRTKKFVPNLGEFLCLLSVSEKYSWDDVAAIVLRETLDRNAGWTLGPYPKLATSSCSEPFRLEKTFLASIVSIRLLVFNVWFLRNVVFRRETSQEAVLAAAAAQRTAGAAGIHLAGTAMERTGFSSFPKLRLQQYNATKGKPDRAVVNRLTEFFKKFREGGGGLESWVEYFQYLNLAPVSAAELDRLLFDRLLEAVRKGYLPAFALRQAQAAAESADELRRNRKKKAELAGASNRSDQLEALADKYDS